MTSTAPRRLRARLIAFVWQAAIISAITLGLLEFLLAGSFRYPSASPIPRSLLRYLHVQFDRNTIQVMPECAIYDDQVTYTLKPGRCTFANREFSNEFRINRLGVRDDEASLHEPQVVMLGDSITMGWGVEQEASFPSVFERMTGRRTLNAGIASFGTVRELKLLGRIDRSAATDLVIQYSSNDQLENGTFVREGGLRVLTRENYDQTVEDHARSLRYFPGKYALNLLVQLRNVATRQGFAQRSDQEGGSAGEAHLFLDVLERSPVPLSSFQIVVLSLDSSFIEAARRLANQSKTPWIASITFLDLGRLSGVEGNFYTLDDHPTAQGHEAIARELVNCLSRRAPTS